MLLRVALCLAAAAALAAGEAGVKRSDGSFGVEWGYTERSDGLKPYGPSRWGLYAPACSGVAQSPIVFPATADFIVGNSVDLRPLQLRCHGCPATVKNTGATVDVAVDPACNCTLQGGLGGVYKLAGFHLHWSNVADGGSEHIVGTTQSAVELHLVHYSSEFPDLATAKQSDKSGALCVLAVLYNIGITPNTELDLITRLANSLSEPGDSEVAVASLSPDQFFPRFMSYFQYNGSLTTPGCNENVRWYVVQTPGTISREQHESLRKFKHQAAGSPVITSNFRPVQPLNGRIAWAFPRLMDPVSFEDQFASPSVATALLVVGILGVVLMACVFVFVLWRAGKR